MKFDQVECYIALSFIISSFFLFIICITLFFIIFKLLEVRIYDSINEKKALDGKEEI